MSSSGSFDWEDLNPEVESAALARSESPPVDEEELALRLAIEQSLKEAAPAASGQCSRAPPRRSAASAAPAASGCGSGPVRRRASSPSPSPMRSAPPMHAAPPHMKKKAAFPIPPVRAPAGWRMFPDGDGGWRLRPVSPPRRAPKMEGKAFRRLRNADPQAAAGTVVRTAQEADVPPDVIAYPLTMEMFDAAVA